MIKSFLDWFDSRTGYRYLVYETLHEDIPSGARFRYVTGSMLVFAFAVQTITGLFLWMAYSPSSQTAYESVWWIQYHLTGGWLLRGLHHFMAQAMVIVLGLHLLQVVWDGAYRKPRELNFWIGLILMQIVMGLGLTGYLLPWDQKGYWATNVATNLATLAPVGGKETQLLAVGGSEYGHHTLTRFFALHAGILPALLVAFLGLHIYVFRRHGITAHITPGRPDDKFWPKQVLFDGLACLALLTLVLGFVIHWDFAGLFSGNLPVEHRGAELGAPSDPSEQFSAARPEWYFLFLFQLLKYFHGSSEIIGAIVLPGLAFSMLFVMPFIGRLRWGHQFNVAFLLLLMVGAIGLTIVAMSEDNFGYVAEKLGLNKEDWHRQIVAAEEFQQAKETAHHDAERTRVLINRQIPKEDGTLSEPLNIQKLGAVYLLRNDPLTQGPKLFKRHCASCHDYRTNDDGYHGPEFTTLQSPQLDTNGQLKKEAGEISYDNAPSGAPNLFGFGSRQWIEGLLDPAAWAKVEYGKAIPASDPKIAAEPDHPDNHKRPVDAPYFGNTKHRQGDMAGFLKDNSKLLTPENRRKIAAALFLQSGRSPQPGDGPLDKTDVADGLELDTQQLCGMPPLRRSGGTGNGAGSYRLRLVRVDAGPGERSHARPVLSRHQRSHAKLRQGPGASREAQRERPRVVVDRRLDSRRLLPGGGRPSRAAARRRNRPPHSGRRSAHEAAGAKSGGRGEVATYFAAVLPVALSSCR